MTTIPSPPPTRQSVRPFSSANLAVAIAVAIVVNVIVFLVASAAGASMLVVQPSPTRLTVWMVIAATLIPLAIAGVIVWLFARRWPVARTIASWAGLVIALGSAATPLFVSGDVATGLALGSMHVIAGVAWFVGVRRVSRAR